jgi:hypothetical protein
MVSLYHKLWESLDESAESEMESKSSDAARSLAFVLIVLSHTQKIAVQWGIDKRITAETVHVSNYTSSLIHPYVICIGVAYVVSHIDRET